MADLAVIILTHNEALHIQRALRQLKGLAKEVFVVDSYSTDATVQIAAAEGATVLQNKFISYSRQFQWALDNAPITAGWIMRLDADEEIGPDLAAEIREKLPLLDAGTAGINLKRRHVFLGRWIRHGGRYPLLLLRIWRRNQGKIEDRWMDEHMIVWGGRTVTFDGEFTDNNLNDLSFFTDKHNRYATREAVDQLIRKHGLARGAAALSSESTSRQAALKRFLKEGLYERTPFWLAASGYFLYRYFIQLGFLDGVEGLIYHFLQGFWYRFLVGAKVLEFERVINRTSSDSGKLHVLSQVSGCQLTSEYE